MSLADLRQAIEHTRRMDGEMHLPAILPEVPGWHVIWDSIGAPTALTLHEPTIEDVEGGFSLSGEGGVLGIEGAALAFVFEDRANGVDVWLTATMPPDVGIEIPGASFGVSGLSFAVQASAIDAGDQATGMIKGTIVAGSLSLPFVVRLPSEAGIWTIEGAANGIPLSGLDQVTALMGDSGLFADLPIDLAALDGQISLSDLFVRVDFGAGRIDQIGVSIELKREITFALGRSALRQPSLRINLNDPSDPTFRSVDVALDGDIVIGGVFAPIRIARVGQEWSARLAGQTVFLPSVRDILAMLGEPKLAEFLPAGLTDLADIEVSRFELAFDEAGKRISKAATAFRTSTPLAFFDEAGPRLADFSIEIEAHSTTADVDVFGRVQGTLVLGDHVVFAIAERVDAESPWVLQTHIDAASTLSLQMMLASLLPSDGASPDNLPDLSLADTEITLIPELGEITLRRQAAEGWSFPDDTTMLMITEVRLEAPPAMTPGTMRDIVVTLAGRAGRDVVDDLTIDAFQVSFGRIAGSWTVSGHAAASIFSTEMTLMVESRFGEGTSALSFVWNAGTDGRLQLVSFDGGPRIEITSLSLSFDQSAGLAISGDVTVAMKGLFDADGHLAVEKGDAGSRLAITVLAPDIDPIEISTGVSPPKLHLNANELSLRFEGAEDQKTEAWSLGGTAGIWFANVPDVIGAFFPTERLDGSLLITSEGLAVTCTLPDVFQPKFPPLALTFANGHRLELGLPEVRIERLSVAAGNDRAEANADLHITVPTEFNHLLGSDEKGRPNQVFLNDAFNLRLSLAAQPTLALRSSPFATLEFFEKDGKTWSNWAFGEFARFSFQTPEFSFANGRWEGSAAMERQGPLKLPLTPIKFALTQIGVDTAIVDSLPTAIPLQEIDIGSKDFNAQLQALLSLDALDDRLAQPLSELADLIADSLDFLPIDFQRYLTFRVPASLAVEFAVGSGGGTTFGIATKDDMPLRLLIPAMSAFGPTLFGFTFKRISLGQILGGSLALLEIDGHVDQFDLPMLLGAPALGKEAGNALRNRFTMADFLAVAPTGLPIPVPLFYKKLAWDLRSVVGLELSSHWSYEKPKPSIFGFIELFGQLKNFMTDADFLLHEQDPPDGLELEFTVDRNLIVLPSYLGGAKLGFEQPLPTLDVYESTARLLDGMKTGNAGYLIEAIPLRHQNDWIRIGRQAVEFGPLRLEAAWCVTTEREFTKQILFDPNAMAIIDAANADGVLSSLPKDRDGSALDQGFIVLLMGAADLAGVIGFRAQFGMAMTRFGGFETAVALRGSIADTIVIEIGGTISVAPPDQGAKVEIIGHARLEIGQAKLVDATGRILVEAGERFEVEITLEFGGSFTLNGLWIIGKDKVSIAGTASWDFADGQKAGGGAEAIFSGEGIAIAFPGRYFGVDCQTQLVLPPSGAARVELSLIIPDTLRDGFKRELVEIADSAESEVDKALTDLRTAIEGYEFELSLRGIRESLPALCNKIIKEISDKITNGVNSRWPTLVSGRAEALRTARANAKPHQDRLKQLRNEVRASKGEQLRPALKGAIQDVINNNRLKVRLNFPLVGSKTVYERDIMTPTQLKQLREAIKAVDDLPAKSEIKIAAQVAFDRIVDRKAILDQVLSGVEEGISENVPEIEWIAYRADFGKIKSELEVKVGIAFKGEERPPLELNIFLDDLQRTSLAIASAFNHSL